MPLQPINIGRLTAMILQESQFSQLRIDNHASFTWGSVLTLHFGSQRPRLADWGLWTSQCWQSTTELTEYSYNIPWSWEWPHRIFQLYASHNSQRLTALIQVITNCCKNIRQKKPGCSVNKQTDNNDNVPHHIKHVLLRGAILSVFDIIFEITCTTMPYLRWRFTSPVLQALFYKPCLLPAGLAEYSSSRPGRRVICV